MSLGTRHMKVQWIALTEDGAVGKDGAPAKGVVVKFSHWIEAEHNDPLDRLQLQFSVEWKKFEKLLDEGERAALRSIREKLLAEIRRDIPKLAKAIDEGGV